MARTITESDRRERQNSSALDTMLLAPSDRVGLFIDGFHLHAACKALDIPIDFKRLLDLFRDRAHLVRALYYTIITDERDCVLRPLLDWLDYNGYTTVRKHAKADCELSRRTAKSSMMVEVAVDIMQLAQSLDHIVIISGAGEFRRLVEMVQINGKRVSVLSTVATRPPMVSDELRRQADQFVDLADLESDIRR
ncbi:LabA-like NYN domain-containing protein [Hyphomicrobium sp.]|uniref:LabA-like NYN domain-containing protein n=1 Tax=Hyphomicrobium sp. TaxID=82 RepID=UPI003F70B2C4